MPHSLVERNGGTCLIRDVLSYLRALLGDINLDPHDWPSIMFAIQSVLNEPLRPRLRDDSVGSTRTLLQTMTGIRPHRLAVQISSVLNHPNSNTFVDGVRAEQLIIIARIQDALDTLHKSVAIPANENLKIESLHIIMPHFGGFTLGRSISKSESN